MIRISITITIIITFITIIITTIIITFITTIVPSTSSPSSLPSPSSSSPSLSGDGPCPRHQAGFPWGWRRSRALVCLLRLLSPQLALPHLRKSRGNVINISSLVGAIGQSQAVPYVATKGAVTAMTKALALDESQYGVRVNCISPGNIWTPLWEELAASTPDPTATIREGTLAQPLGRMGQPAEVGAAAVFLASEANFCTGIELFVTGGAELGYGCKAKWGAPVEAPTIPP
ncbi:hypothetical protein HPG69_000407 [Diceros bicornis minor]|uniref:17-beta-hydroxysteroid dehydrogenase 14 n=1 Tax=Diceros bicornis minor TaxID=77932 RepID=A0A7J7FDZ3_DICBM|nr:hypothetical protein HPG69_000407 [Diceros bicornis minor]